MESYNVELGRYGLHVLQHEHQQQHRLTSSREVAHIPQPHSAHNDSGLNTSVVRPTNYRVQRTAANGAAEEENDVGEDEDDDGYEEADDVYFDDVDDYEEPENRLRGGTFTVESTEIPVHSPLLYPQSSPGTTEIVTADQSPTAADSAAFALAQTLSGTSSSSSGGEAGRTIPPQRRRSTHSQRRSNGFFRRPGPNTTPASRYQPSRRTILAAAPVGVQPANSTALSPGAANVSTATLPNWTATRDVSRSGSSASNQSPSPIPTSPLPVSPHFLPESPGSQTSLRDFASDSSLSPSPSSSLDFIFSPTQRHSSSGPFSSYLKVGKTFIGTQNLMSTHLNTSSFAGGGHKEEWEVRVTINSVDYSTGTVIGLMEALNVPATSTTVVTYWEGEIIDFINHTLWTRKWQADLQTDLLHWKKFDALKGLNDQTIIHSFPGARHIHQKYIFMRWKEQFFVNMAAQDSGLTIAGFYYVCLRRKDGHIQGFYFDPSSTPYQKLTLLPHDEGKGVSFPEYSFA